MKKRKKKNKRNKNAFELEKQLHEQYAINNNAHTSSFISFVVALFALFGTLGYVYAYSQPYIYSGKDMYSLDIFLLLSVVVSGMLLFLACISTQIGWGQRRDQIVIETIRKNYNMGGVYNSASNKDYWSFLPDYYNIFFWLFVSAQFFVIILVSVKMNTCIFYSFQNCCCEYRFVPMPFLMPAIVLIWYISCIVVSFVVRGYYYKKYKEFLKKT